MQKTVSGIRVRGSWNEVVDKGRDVTAALKDADVAEDELADWEEWRPRRDDRLEKEVRDRTVEQARVRENAVEQEGKTAVDAAGEAVGDVGEAVDAASAGQVKTASRQSGAAVKRFGVVVDTVARKLVRRVETVVYRYFVTWLNPYYFDSDLVSARIEKRGALRPKQDEEFELAVDINDDGMQEAFSREMAERS